MSLSKQEPIIQKSSHLQVVTNNEPGYLHFGAFLRSFRERTGMTLEDVVEIFEPHFKQHQLELLSGKTYGNLERDDRFPRFEELWPIFCGLMDICKLHQIRFTELDCLDFVRLAQQKTNASTKWRKMPQRWEELKQKVLQLINTPGPQRATSYFNAQNLKEHLPEPIQNTPQSEIDTKHIFGREPWLVKMLSYIQPQAASRKKVIVIQASIGEGKTSCFKLLYKHLLETEDSIIVYHECLTQEKQSPAEHLDVVLAHILNHLKPHQEHEYPAPQKHIDLVMEAIQALHKRVVILIDDAHVLLEASGSLYPDWQLFLKKILGQDHQASVFIATREWPGWTDREDIYLLQTTLELLSDEACIQLWRRLGYHGESEKRLLQATKFCCGNPRMIEIVAVNLEKPLLSLEWSTNWQDAIETPERQGLDRFLEDPHYLSNTILDAYPLLEETISTRLSTDARQLLSVLAISQLPLPVPLLLEFTQHPKRCIKELMHTSLLARDPDRLRLLPLVTESILQQITEEEKCRVEEKLIVAYQRWITEGNYRNEHEQAAVIVELSTLYLKHCRMLEAADLMLNHGWLSFKLGHALRITRIAQQMIAESREGELTPEQEIASILIQNRLAKYRGEKITTKQRGTLYFQIYNRVKEEKIRLERTTMVHLIQPIVISLADTEQFEKAQSIVKEQLSYLEERNSESHVSYLYFQAYLFAKWGEYYQEQAYNQADRIKKDHLMHQARALFIKAARLFKQCISLLHQEIQRAAPLKKSTLQYKLARRLNDYAYYARISGGDFPDIKQSLLECIDLKQRGFTLPISLPITYGEYAQFLISQGQYSEALAQSDLALQQMEQLVKNGYSSSQREMAILQIERGELYLLLGELDKAQCIFEQAQEFVQGNVRRKQYKRKVDEGLQTIERIKATLLLPEIKPLRGQLDFRWFDRFAAIANYDIYGWLEPSGPFTKEEESIWNSLDNLAADSEKTRKRLMIASLERELDKAVAEKRNPLIMYRTVPIDEVQQKISDCNQLLRDIDYDEKNVLVASLYREAINEQLYTLGLAKACYERDAKLYTYYNDLLNHAPTAQEMDIATKQLIKILNEGMSTPQTKDLSLKLFSQLQELLLVSPYRNLEREYQQERRQLKQERRSAPDRDLQKTPSLTAEEIKRFFEKVFSTYGFYDWQVKIDPSALNARVEPYTQQLIISPRSQNLDKVLHLLAHEIECHIYRFANGTRSKLSLLGYGTANYLPTEEALATHYTSQVELKSEAIPWIGTLATGLASGAKRLLGGRIEPHNFNQLYAIMRDYHQLNLMIKGKDAEIAAKKAHSLALARCLRTLGRGAPLGACFTKDNCYLRGHLILTQEKEHAENNGIDIVERLNVGAIGIEHIGICEQLGITMPIIKHKRLSYHPHIRQYILSFREGQPSVDEEFSEN